MSDSENRRAEDVAADCPRAQETVDDADVLHCLADDRRLTLLRTLRESHGPVSLDALARRLSDGPTACQDVRLSLYHVHLPKLRAAGLVRTDNPADAVRLAVDDDALTDLLAATEALADAAE